MILVTGAAGLNGTAIVREFSRNGAAVRALIRARSKAVALAELPCVEVVEGGMARPETLDRALEGIDRALIISSSDPQMVDVQCRFVDACKAAGVAHVVKFSGKESNIGFDAAKPNTRTSLRLVQSRRWCELRAYRIPRITGQYQSFD